jgi:PHP family Zn ribbon phosphoesterase
MSFSQGLRFRKFDLQVHTPASKCFFNQDVTPDQIVAQAIKMGLSGIAITDHNTGEWIDKIKKAAQGQPLVIFPGVEIHVPSGQRGIHVLAILDVDRTSTQVAELCGALNIKEINGELISQHGLNDVIDIVSNNIHNGLIILAHCTGPKGVLSEMAGLQVSSTFDNANLLAVDVPETDFTDPEKIAKKLRVIDLLDGTNTKYCNRKLAVIQTSDNPHHTEPGKHGLEGIGRRYTYLKVDDKVTLESLRLCFVDRETRVRQPFEYKEHIFPAISGLSIKGGFLNGVSVPLHKGLNCVLGAKGTGKSLVVEFLRFALDQRPTHNEIKADHDQKLASRLQRYSEITVKFTDETGKELTIVRQYNPPANPYKNAPAADVARLFPVLFLSQNEIIRVAENEEEQLKFIDRFFDFRSHQLRIEELEKELRELDREFARGLRAIHENREQKKQLTYFDDQLTKLSEQMKNPIYDAFEQGDKIDKVFDRHRRWLDEAVARVQEFRAEVQKTALPVADEIVMANPQLQRTLDLCKEQAALATSVLGTLEQDMERNIAKLQEEYQAWLPNFEQTKKKYEDAVREDKADYKMLDQRRAKLTTDREAVAKKTTQSQALVDKIKEVTDKREEKLRQLAEAYVNYLRDRLSKCKKFEADSQGKLSVSIKPSTNVDEFKSRLTGMKRGSYLSDEDIQKICNSMTPKDFILYILRFDSSKNNHHLKPIAEKTGLGMDKIEKLASHLLASNEYEGLLELQYKARPQDRPEIRYRVANGRFELLKDLSIGQKCTAMLIMTLSDGTMPVVVDQPEDSLDIRSIWEDMCAKLRTGKDGRQFVFTTHSSSLAVASDTDKFIVLEADATSGKVVFCGAIDTEAVREQVIEYLEGGIPTYRSKYLKYNIPRRKLFS